MRNAHDIKISGLDCKLMKPRNGKISRNGEAESFPLVRKELRGPYSIALQTLNAFLRRLGIRTCFLPNKRKGFRFSILYADFNKIKSHLKHSQSYPC